MFGHIEDDATGRPMDRDEMAIRHLLDGLMGDETDLPDHVMVNLTEAATMALHHGRRMQLESQHAFDALAALCLVLGSKRIAFFENVFVARMVSNTNLTAQEKLKRVIEIVIGTIPRPAPCRANDTTRLETA